MGLLDFYPFIKGEDKRPFSKKPIVMNSICMKKKDPKDKSVKNRSSNSNSRSKKNSSSKNSSKQHRRNGNQSNNIYMNKNKEDIDFNRSTSPKTLSFKKTINLKTVKSGSDLMKGVINSRH